MSNKILGILKHSAENGFNVLLEGSHGVGKTEMVKQVFDKLGWVWKYFSASTIDPWVDLVGVPKEKDGVLELIRPATLDFDNLEAIFLDEYNRAPKKVRNAVMELIQFGSINGKKFPKLKVVFAAINPDDDDDLTYDVEKLDPAQIDRFPIHLPVPNKPCAYFFKEKHASSGALAVKWWMSQTDEVKKLISPRRLEQGLQVFLAKGDVQYVFNPDKVNVGEFCEYMDKPDPIKVLMDMCGKTDAEKRKFLQTPNTFKHIKKDLMGKDRFLDEFGHLIPDPLIMSELCDNTGNKISGYVVANVSKFKHLIQPVLSNHRRYAGRVVDAFRVYQRTGGASSNLKDAGREVIVKGKKILVKNLNLCFTGTLVSFKREEAQQMMADYGAQTTNTVTFQTTHLVAGENTGKTKLERAKKNGVEIMTEEDFNKMLQELGRSAPVK